MPPVAELAGLVVALLATGVVAGLLAGVFGIGGGAVIVPVLYQFLLLLGIDHDLVMQIAVGSSLGVIVPTSIRSFLAHRAHGAVDEALLKEWLLPVPLGAIAAGFLIAIISGEALRIVFVVLATLMALRLLFGRQSWRLGADLPGRTVRVVVGFLIGLFSTLMGVGGGVFNNAFMTLYGRSMHQAVATSAGVGVLIAIPGVLGTIWAGWGRAGLPPLSLGFVNLLAVLLLIPVTMAMAPIGARLAHRTSRRRLEIGFGLFLLVVALRFLVSLV
ncbi:sulfite exporter TauE/SafE family protein [Prosthecomicrobium pneumaticum]|nr:sulfite exporter TauE/SafE family protein [Prosthecomicrobium pneumaticum]